MATYSSFLAWRIPWIEEPGQAVSIGSQRVRHDLATEQEQQQQGVGGVSIEQCSYAEALDHSAGGSLSAHSPLLPS